MSNTKISMQDIADQLHVSKNTVSLALSGKSGVSEHTRQMIEELAEKLGYKKKETSISERRNILVVIPEYIRDDRYFYNDIYWEIDNSSSKLGNNTIMSVVTPAMESQHLLPVVCNDIVFSGVLLIGILSDDYVSFLKEKYPCILSVDHCFYNLGISCIVTANIEGSYLLTKKVIEHHHKKIGFIGSVTMTDSIYERWCGFQLAMQEEKLDCDRYNVKHESPLSVLLSDEAEMANLIRSMPELPTAFICGGDRIAIACINALNSLGYRVPQDISVVGFDDIEISQYITPKLTTMHIRRHHMAKEAVSELQKLLHQKNQLQKRCLFANYVERESLADACSE